MSTRRESKTGRTIYKHAPRHASDKAARATAIACVAMMPVALIVSVFV